MKLFAYGTLMNGFGNHFNLDNNECSFIDYGETIKHYSMHILSNIPFVHNDEELYPIYGEIYNVSDDVMEIIDNLECNKEWYTRNIVTVKLKGGENMECWLYFCNEKGFLSPHGDYKNINRKKEYGFA